MWGVTQFSSSTLSPIRSYAESSPPRHRMVVSKKEMLFILWKLSEVRTCTHGNGGRDERMMGRAGS